MSDLTREQVEALAKAKDNTAYAEVGTNPTVWYWPNDGYDSIKRVTADTVIALATEVLAQRERRCGTCREWHPEGYKSGFGECQHPEEGFCSRPAEWCCADWAAKEER